MGRKERQTLKQELKQIYQVKEPAGKRAFLKKMEPHEISIRHMLWLQVCYIPKWIWILSAAIVARGIYCSHYLQSEILGMICAVIPFLVMVSVTQSMGAIRHGMEELEMVSRFSMKSILLARMSILGMGNLLTIMLLIPVLDGMFWKNILYIFAPFLLTAYGSLCIVRHFPGKEGTYGCAAVAATVSCVELAMELNWEMLSAEKYTILWFVSVVILLFLTLRESRRTIRMTEELVWS